MTYQIDGIILIDKDEGESSFDVVRKVKKTLKIKKIGHAGTLDPFATGLLVILVGQGTKLSPFIMSQRKFYSATLRLGIETDTLDKTGRVIKENPVRQLSLEHIRLKAGDFIGDIEQTPPAYSALKCMGTRAYKLARNGEEVILKKRKVSIKSLQIVSVVLPDIIFEVECASGTYIRSLAADLGSSLGPGGHLISLRRIASGPFIVDGVVSSRDIGTEIDSSALQKMVIPMISAIPGMREINTEQSIAQGIRLGRQSVLPGLVRDLDLAVGSYLKIVCNGELVAVTKVNPSGRDAHGRLEIVRVFS